MRLIRLEWNEAPKIPRLKPVGPSQDGIAPRHQNRTPRKSGRLDGPEHLNGGAGGEFRRHGLAKIRNELVRIRHLFRRNRPNKHEGQRGNNAGPGRIDGCGFRNDSNTFFCANGSDFSSLLLEEQPTEAQLVSLRALVDYLRYKYEIRYLAGHKDYPNQSPDGTECPGDNLYPVLPDLARELGMKYGIEGYVMPEWARGVNPYRHLEIKKIAKTIHMIY